MIEQQHIPRDIPRVEHEAELAALAAYDADAWLAGGSPGMSREAAEARAAMTDAHADPFASADDVAEAEARYHAACLAQAEAIAAKRDAAAAVIESLMQRASDHTITITQPVAEQREQAVSSSALSHTGLVSHTLLAARISDVQAAPG